MLAREPGTSLPDTDVAHVDAATDPVNFFEPLRHLDEPAGVMARRVLKKQRRRAGPPGQAAAEFGERGHQGCGLRAHVRLVVDDHAGQASREAGSELLDYAAVALAQHVQPAAQVDRGQAGVGGHVFEYVIQLIGGVGVRFSGEARLGEAEPGQPEQGSVTGYALLEQRVDRRQA